MRYVLEVYLPRCDGWFTTFKGKSLIELGRQITKCQKANHKYRVSKEKRKNVKGEKRSKRKEPTKQTVETPFLTQFCVLLLATLCRV